jgi:DNA-binding response OmpR family regulator
VNASEGRGSVLIVATDRDDRRVLFDALDSQEFDAIYTAKDVAQARAFLEQDPQIDLVLLEFLDDARAALTFCGELRKYHPGTPVPVIGILAGKHAQKGAHWDRMPPGVVEWITSPVHAGEAMARINAVLSVRTEPTRAPAGARCCPKECR